MSDNIKKSALAQWRGDLPSIALTLLIGAAGGTIFDYFGLPLAWVLGAMCATTLTALAGAPLIAHNPMRNAMIAVLGALLGSTFSPAVFAQLLDWSAGAAIVLAVVAAIIAVSTCMFHYLAGFDRTTAFFCATPGGLAAMTVIGEDFGGNSRTIPLVHAVRIATVVFMVPVMLTILEGADLSNRAAFSSSGGIAGPADLALLAATALAGYLIVARLKVPAPALIGPMAACACLYLFDWVEGSPPDFLVVIAQITIGSFVGARFVGLNMRQLARPVVFAILSALMMLACAAAAATLAAPYLGIERAALLLALSPGGVAEMSLIALSLDIDVAFVSTMHAARILFIVVLAPLAFRLLLAPARVEAEGD